MEKEIDDLKENSTDSLGVGDRIKILRINQKRTMQEVADSCGLSKSMISKIENNKTIPSVATLVKIAQTLGTNISNLFEHEGWTKAIVTTKRNWLPPKKVIRFFHMLQPFTKRKCSHFCS